MEQLRSESATAIQGAKSFLAKASRKYANQIVQMRSKQAASALLEKQAQDIGKMARYRDTRKQVSYDGAHSNLAEFLPLVTGYYLALKWTS